MTLPRRIDCSNLAKGCALSLRADEAEPQREKKSWSERHSLSTHQAAQPQKNPYFKIHISNSHFKNVLPSHRLPAFSNFSTWI
jgi:hypothetical protein